MLNLDMHILIFAVLGQLRLAEERLMMSQPWAISSIVLWEIAKLAFLGRIEVDLNHPRVVEVLDEVRVLPVTLDVCRALPRLDFRSDPADAIIAATSIAYNVPLLTRDSKILRSAIVPLVEA